MQKVKISDLGERERVSPKGKYRSFAKDISVALGREDASLDLWKRHPFDLGMVRIPPGAIYCPYHAESAQWELYLVVSGEGIARDAEGETEVGPGDSFLFKPSEAHQLSNRGAVDFVYYVVADNPIGDCAFYPDSGKWNLPKADGSRLILRPDEVSYYDGEE